MQKRKKANSLNMEVDHFLSSSLSSLKYNVVNVRMSHELLITYTDTGNPEFMTQLNTGKKKKTPKKPE